MIILACLDVVVLLNALSLPFLLSLFISLSLSLSLSLSVPVWKPPLFLLITVTVPVHVLNLHIPCSSSFLFSLFLLFSKVKDRSVFDNFCLSAIHCLVLFSTNFNLNERPLSYTFRSSDTISMCILFSTCFCFCAPNLSRSFTKRDGFYLQGRRPRGTSIHYLGEFNRFVKHRKSLDLLTPAVFFSFTLTCYQHNVCISPYVNFANLRCSYA